VLAARVWRTYLDVRLALRRDALPEAVARLGTSESNRKSRPPALLSRAVDRSLRLGSHRPRCLTRSLVLYRLLRAQGADARLVIGLAHDARVHDAHAWVELGGRDVGPWPGRFGHEELVRYPPDPNQDDSRTPVRGSG